MKFVLQANTPEQTKMFIVGWLRLQATNYSSAARTATLVRTRKRDEAMAGAYEDAANFLERAEIEPLIIN